MGRSSLLPTLLLTSITNWHHLRSFVSVAASASTSIPSSSSSTTTHGHRRDGTCTEVNSLSSSAAVVVDTYIGLGSNVGDRVEAFREALQHLRRLGKVACTSFLYETPPMYVTDQATFLNAACHLQTSLSPEQLLMELKNIETIIGRKQSFRNGPRLIDVDIILYGNHSIDTPHLQIPHQRLHERAFVLRPLCDMNPSLQHPTLNQTMKELLKKLPLSACADIKRVVPLGKDRQTNTTRLFEIDNSNDNDNDDDSNHSSPVRKQDNSNSNHLQCDASTLSSTSTANSGGTGRRNRTRRKMLVCGILNVTPDSFSDGGQYYHDNQSNPSVALALQKAEEMVRDGVDIIDVGGESTRPGSTSVLPHIEKQRVVPVIHAIRNSPLTREIIISVDTRNADVAKAAVEAGADMINDVSGGTHDVAMFETVGALNVPYVLMHTRGTPQTMTSIAHTTYGPDLLGEIGAELDVQLVQANAYLPKWLQIVDPGIGFAKNSKENLRLLQQENLQRLSALVGHRMLFVGASRKRFLGELSPLVLTIVYQPSDDIMGFVYVCVCMYVCRNDH